MTSYLYFSSDAKESLPLGVKGTIELRIRLYEGWNFNSGNYLFTTDTK